MEKEWGNKAVNGFLNEYIESYIEAYCYRNTDAEVSSSY